MTRISSAMKHDESDGLTPLERAAKNKMILGLFIPLQNGAWTPSTYPEELTGHLNTTPNVLSVLRNSVLTLCSVLPSGWARAD